MFNPPRLNASALYKCVVYEHTSAYTGQNKKQQEMLSSKTRRSNEESLGTEHQSVLEESVKSKLTCLFCVNLHRPVFVTMHWYRSINATDVARI